MKKLNVGFILRKAAMASTPVMTIAEVHGCPHLSFDFYLFYSNSITLGKKRVCLAI